MHVQHENLKLEQTVKCFTIAKAAVSGQARLSTAAVPVPAELPIKSRPFIQNPDIREIISSEFYQSRSRHSGARWCQGKAKAHDHTAHRRRFGSTAAANCFPLVAQMHRHSPCVRGNTRVTRHRNWERMRTRSINRLSGNYKRFGVVQS